ncbi:MAG: YceD family protein [Verrucomicrobiota bacterium]
MERCISFRLAKIPPEGERYRGVVSGDILALSGDVEYTSVDEVSYDLFVQEVSDRFIVKGSLWTRVKFICVRCAVEGMLNVKVSDFRAAKELEKDSEYVDLTQDIREAIILAFPGYPVCRSGCMGLCPQCGKNLNEGQCECEPQRDSRWSALDELGLMEE